jgi:hypothetical protein
MRISTVVLASCLSVDAFTPLISKHTPSCSPSALFAGGFGGGGSTKGIEKKPSSKQTKLKPKQQWDRFLALKATTKVPVGVRMKEDNTEEWIQVGYVRSKEDAYTEISVTMQRALVAEVS